LYAEEIHPIPGGWVVHRKASEIWRINLEDMIQSANVPVVDVLELHLE
jgi:hypothetical protein